jgi:hypothetical protein
MKSVEAALHLNVKSTYIVKTNTMIYPMEALHSVLRAWFGNKKVGHWVVFKTMIAYVDQTVAHHWSQYGVSYFMTICGNTATSSVLYMNNLQDDVRNVDYKFLPRPQICYFIYDYVSIIDEHNKKLKHVLGLERKRPTKDRWFRLIITIVGYAARWYAEDVWSRKDGTQSTVVRGHDWWWCHRRPFQRSPTWKFGQDR